MKLYHIIYIICLALTLTSCNKSSEEIESTILTLSPNKSEVYTNETEYSFDILSGGGYYVATIVEENQYDNYASASVSGNKVTVKLVAKGTHVRISDKLGQQKDLIIWSTNNSLQPIVYDIAMGLGFQNTGKFEWGSGEGFTILKNGNTSCAQLFLKDNGEYVVNSIAPGTTAYIIKDSRGSVNAARITVWQGWELNSNELNANVLAGYQYTFIINWGDGNTKVTNCSKELKNAWLLIAKKNEYQDKEVLQACVDKGSKGQFFIELTDKSDNKATIILNAE